MKKILLLLFCVAFTLSGCNKDIVDKPYEIKLGNTTLSYYDDEIPSEFINDKYTIYKPKEQIRCISISDKKAYTMHNIRVGDSIDKITSNYVFHYKLDNTYYILFDGSAEISPTYNNKKDDWLWIAYKTDGSKILGIDIFDFKFGRTMQ